MQCDAVIYLPNKGRTVRCLEEAIWEITTHHGQRIVYSCNRHKSKYVRNDAMPTTVYRRIE